MDINKLIAGSIVTVIVIAVFIYLISKKDSAPTCPHGGVLAHSKVGGKYCKFPDTYSFKEQRSGGGQRMPKRMSIEEALSQCDIADVCTGIAVDGMGRTSLMPFDKWEKNNTTQEKQYDGLYIKYGLNY